MWNEYFTGKTVIISGGSTGIGAGAAQAFARAGAHTIVADVQDSIGEELVRTLVAEGHSATFRHCDVGNEDDVEQVFALARDAFGDVDVAYANAGVEWTKDARHTTLEEWDHVLNVNLTGVFLVCRAAMRSMCERRTGSIVVTSSPHAWATVSDGVAYAASKGGVSSLVRALALEGAPYGVRVNGVVPGSINTPMIQREAQATSNPEEALRLMDRSQPWGRIGEPNEVANVTMFLASPLAEFVTGSLYSVDGGLMAALPMGPFSFGG
ncbi:MAG: SDR family oxidoreductase [Acidimicrobiales bacterium]|jgi:NAD(P)-dependent dehydrogenase (short-subunit alcohol dehydrogenase family)